MSKPTGLLSPDRVERRDHLRRIIRGAAHARDVDIAPLGRRLGYTDSRWNAIMTRGELSSVSAADVPLLDGMLGGSVVLAEGARAEKMRLVPELEAVATPGEVLAGISDQLASAASVATAGTAALADGVLDPVEARDILDRIEVAHRALSQLRARVEAKTVEPIRRGAR